MLNFTVAEMEKDMDTEFKLLKIETGPEKHEVNVLKSSNRNKHL